MKYIELWNKWAEESYGAWYFLTLISMLIGAGIEAIIHNIFKAIYG